MKRSLEMPVTDGHMDGTEFIGPLSALPEVQKATLKKYNKSSQIYSNKHSFYIAGNNSYKLKNKIRQKQQNHQKSLQHFKSL